MGSVKEILCLHHSHLDIGYTHPQPLLMELQRDYIDEAIELCLQTEKYPEESKFRWTCEATLPVLKWLETAPNERVSLFKHFLQNGQISISALMMHSTPLNNTNQMIKMLQPIKALRERFNIPVNTAINHDVNGQPWPLSQIMLDAGIDFYITGINIHFGGIPFKRPAVFNWETPDKRKLLTFQGEHYSIFSQFFETSKEDTALMAKGIDNYVNRLEENGYEYDFVYLTATNPPLFDNNCPDPKLASLIRKYNEENHKYKIRFVTPEMLLERVRNIDPALISSYAGDWTDYWNFGSGSSARETSFNRNTKEKLRKADFLEAFQGSPGVHYDNVKEESILNTLLYEEHTWGAAQSITDPEDFEVYSQQNHKSHMAYQAADLSAYLLGKQMEKLADNPLQSKEPEGIMLINTSDVEQDVEIRIPEDYLSKGRHLSAARMKQFLPYANDSKEGEYYGSIKLSPFSWRKIPFRELDNLKMKLDKNQPAYTVTDNSIETPYYIMNFNPKTGRIEKLFDKKRQWSILDETSEWTLFEYVRESIDPLKNKEERATFFPRDVDLGNKSISVWNHDWKAIRKGPNQLTSWNIKKTKDTVTYVMLFEAEGVRSLEQRITFSVYHSKIEFVALLDKEDIKTPESIYFALPLNIQEDWRAYYDTADMFVELDEEQIGTVSKDWITVGKTVSLCDEQKGITLACPDAPLVQIGDFNFGKESKSIKRNKNPLLLAWAMNNYWDTNFWVSQPGPVQFKYELSPFDSFNEMDAYKVGVSAAKPVEMNVAVHCPKEVSGNLLSISSEKVVPLSIRKDKSKKGIIVTLRNLTNTSSNCKISILNKKVKAASIVNILEEKLADIEPVDSSVELDLQARQLIQLFLYTTD